MNRKEAIKTLKHIVPGDCKAFEAVKTAVEALKQPEIIRCKDCYYFIPPKDRDYHCYSCRETWSQHTIVYENDFCSKAIRSADVYKRRAKDGEQDG